jgi:hypothetical protein
MERLEQEASPKCEAGRVCQMCGRVHECVCERRLGIPCCGPLSATVDCCTACPCGCGVGERVGERRRF